MNRLLHGHGGGSRGGGGFRDEHDPAGFAVQTVDERDLAAIREFIAQQVTEPVPERPGAVRLGGVNQKSGRFVHDKEVRSFAEDLEVCLNKFHNAAMVVANMIHLRNVTRTYSSGSRVVRALDSVTLDIAAGAFVTISGPSGCGKSTMLNLLGGLDRPDSVGRICPLCSS